MIFTLSGISLFILFMAIINFVNIAISRADMRIREVGVRKVLGSERKALASQFYLESTFLKGKPKR